jgi:type IX secretion system PorP/SprF family membrane protein
MKHFLLCIMCAFAISFTVLAQDPLFSQFYYAPVYTNPGLAGTMRNNFRVTGITRMQWTRVKQPFIYTNLAVEKHLPGPQASFAFSFNRFSEGYLRTTGAYLTLAKNFGNRTEECHELFINMAIQIGWAWKGLNTQKLLFSDQLDETQGILGINSEAEILRQPNQNYLDAGAGVVATWRSWSAGSALHHINRPHDGLGGSSRSSKLPIRFTAHLSYSSEKDAYDYQPIIVKPTAMLNVQGKSSSLSIGTLVDFKEYFIELGIWYRHNADFGGNNSHSISAGLNFRFSDMKGAYNNGVDRRTRLGTSVDAYIYNPSNRNTGLSFEAGGFYDGRSPNSDYEGLCPTGDCPNKFPWQFF